MLSSFHDRISGKAAKSIMPFWSSGSRKAVLFNLQAGTTGEVKTTGTNGSGAYRG